MAPTGLLDDDTIEAIVAGDEVDARFDQLVAFARHVRTLGDEPPPAASPALEAVFAGSDLPGHRARHLASHRTSSTPPPSRRRLAGAVGKVAGLGLAAQIGLGASVAAAGVVAAGAGGVLPEPATNGVRSAIEAVTPIDFGGSGASDEPARRDDPDRFGDRVSSDATGESDGSPGVDGGEISDEAPGAAHRPGTTDNPGLDRAGETPAAPNLPDQAGESGQSGSSGSSAGSGAGGGSNETDDQPTGVDDTPGATAPGATAPGRTVEDPAATPSSTIPPSAPAGTATTGRAGGGGNSAVQGG